MRQVRVYTASKLQHAELWKQCRAKFPEIYFTARWPFYVGQVPDSPSRAEQFWQDDLADVARSDIVLVYAASSDEKLRGALIEAGMGIALGKRIALIGDYPDYSTWQWHPSVEHFKTVEEALNKLQDYEVPEETCL